METRGAKGKPLRKIRVLNGARAILEILQNQPFRCVFVGGMPIHLFGGKVPLGLDLVLVPQPGYQTPLNVKNLLCQHQSTKFKFTLDRKQLKYVDLTGEIPTGKQSWCEVRITLIQPSQFDVDNIVEICGIPTVRIFAVCIDKLQDLFANQYNLPRTGSQRGELWPTKKQFKELRTIMEPLLKEAVVPKDLDQACTALSLFKQLIGAVSGRSPPSTKIQQLTDRLQRISVQLDNWVTTHRANVDDDRGLSPVIREGPELPSGAVGEDCDESDDWVKVTMPAGVVEIHGRDSHFCGERGDDVFDFEILSID